MKTTIKFAAAATLAGALALGMATPSQANEGRNAAAAIGFGIGAFAGAAAASAAANSGYYGPGPYYSPGPYAYEPDYAPRTVYAPAPAVEAYDYSPGGQCWITTDSSRGFGYYGSCAQAPRAPGARTPREEAR